MIGQVHAFAGRGDDQPRFERLATEHFAAVAEKGRLALSPLWIRRTFWGDAGGYIAECYVTGVHK